MKRLLFVGASVLLIAVAAAGDAFAQRGGRGGGGAGFSGGGFRGGAIGGGYRGGAIGGGYRGAAIRGGYRGAVVRGGHRGAAVAGRRYVGPRGAVRSGYARAGRRAVYGGRAVYGRRTAYGRRAIYGRRVWVGRPGWRPGWGYYGWGWPVAAGVAVGVASAYGSCLRWDGYQWVDVCYQPYAYGVYDGYGNYYDSETTPW